MASQYILSQIAEIEKKILEYSYIYQHASQKKENAESRIEVLKTMNDLQKN